ncbi:MAG: glycosyltransferase [Microthrixaceae bacterium]
MARTKVLLLARGLGPGGMERLLVNQVRFGDRTRFDHAVAFITPAKDQLVPEFEDLGVPVHWLSGGGRPWPANLAGLLRRGGFDVVHVHSPLPAAAVRVLARATRPRPRVVYTEHNSWGPYHPLTRKVNAWTYRLDDAQIAVSRDAWSSVPEALRGRLEVLDHGIDLDAVCAHRERRAEARRRLGVDDDTIVVGTVANFRPEKNYEGWLRVADRVTADRPEVRFVSIGQGPLLDDIRARATAAGLQGRVELMGHQPDAPALMAGFDVFAMASHWEGLPVAFMEARALGLPVVTTAVGGLVDHVHEGVDGLLVPADDDSALADALGRVVDDADLRARLAGASAAAAGSFDARVAVAAIEERFTP